VDSVVQPPQDKDKDGHEQSFFDGIDETLPGLALRLGDEEKKVPWLQADLASVAAAIKHAVDKGESNDPASAAEPLLQVVESLEATMDRLKASTLTDAAKQTALAILQTKQQEAQRAANIALSVHLQASVTTGPDLGKTAPPFKDALTLVSPGQLFQVIARLHNGSDRPLQVGGAELEGGDGWVQQADAGEATIKPGQDYYANFALKVPDNAASTRPYWHRDNPETDALNTIDEPLYQTLPFPPPPLKVSVQYDVLDHPGRQSPVPDVIRRAPKPRPVGEISATVFVPFTDESGTRDKTPLSVAPAFSLSLEPGEQVLPVQDGKNITVNIGVSSNLTGALEGSLRLSLPPGWRSQPEQIVVNLPHRGDKQDFSFQLMPGNLHEGRTEIRAVLQAGGKKYTEGYALVTREDLGTAYYYQPAKQRLSVIDVKVPKDLKVGYIMGAGDDIPTVLEQIGIDVTLIPAEKLGSEDLSRYQTIVLGIRAYDTQKDVIANNKRLLDFVQAGGRLVVQYNTLGFGPAAGDFNAGKYTPYPATLSRARVSVEEAPVAILDPANPIFHFPNEITQKDFEGWVQERGLYFMSDWDSNFVPLLESHDPGEKEQKGGLLIAHYGKGTYIYTGYAFFRQLPAGVPGAVRLFVNLVAGHQ